MKPQDFIDKIAPGAVADMKKKGIPASLTIAQAILESAWGESIADHSKLILNGTRDKPTRYHGVLGVDYKYGII
ncbi:N-acetylmuramoyl-L-alanine amidase [Brevibacillus laterosporus]|nr:N-acetylmuramoyl-L-alanine amidase [Brevibacillus laterosporus]